MPWPRYSEKPPPTGDIDVTAAAQAVVPADELRTFAARLLGAAGASADEAAMVARILVWSDLRGREPQGVFRIPVLAKMLANGLVTSPAAMTFEQLAPAAARLDAANGFGQIAGDRAMRRAVELAGRSGIGLVGVKNSNHYGAASYFCSLAAEAGCAGFAFTNATPKVTPHGGRKPVFGTNPVAFGCPAPGGAPILVDFSTSAIAGSTIRMINASGGSLPEGVALDKSGAPTVDPKALNSGSLLPAAGAKGYGLSLMVEILCGILSGAAMSHEVGPMYSTWKKSASPGHFFMALAIGRLMPEEAFLARIGALISEIKSSPVLEGFGEILLPGEIRGRFAREYGASGVPLSAETVRLLSDQARGAKVPCPWPDAVHAE